VLDPDWEASRDALIQACEADGTGTLMLPTMLADDVMPVIVDTYSVTEHQAKGGYAEFTINFIEAGRETAAAANTQDAANGAANTAATADPSTPDMPNAQAPALTDEGVGANSAPSLTDEGVGATAATQITPAAGDTSLGQTFWNAISPATPTVTGPGDILELGIRG
jgi:hypothetical protein